MDPQEVHSIVGDHASTTKGRSQVKAGLRVDTSAVRDLDSSLAKVRATAKGLADELQRAANASDRLTGGTSGGGPKAANGMPLGQNTSPAPNALPSNGAGGIGGRGGFGGSAMGSFGAGNGFGGGFFGGGAGGLGPNGIKPLIGIGAVGYMASMATGAIDQRVDRNRQFALTADRQAVETQMRMGWSQKQYSDYRSQIVGNKNSSNVHVDPTALIGFQNQTGISAMQQRQSVGAIRALSGFSMGTQDVLNIMQQNLDPATANRQFIFGGGRNMYGPGGKPRDYMSVLNERVNRYGLDQESTLAGAKRLGSFTRRNMTVGGITADEQDLLINLGEARNTFRKKGGKGVFDPTNAEHRKIVGVEDNFATQFDETSRLKQKREEDMYKRQADNYADLEKSNQGLINALNSLENKLEDLIGARTSNRNWMNIGGKVLQGVGMGLMIAPGPGTLAGAGMIALGAAASSSGDPTDNSKGGTPGGVVTNSSAANDNNIKVPVGYGGQRKTLNEVKARSDFQKMHPKMQQRMLAMFRENPNLGIGGGFRDPSEQKSMFLDRYEPTDEDTGVYWNGQNWKRVKGAPAAPPGRSMHEIGLAADLVGDLDWLQKNAQRFGLKTFADVNNVPWHVQAVELPNSRAKYEAGGSPWGTNGDFDEDADFTEVPGSTSEHLGMADSQSSGVAGGSDYTGLSMADIIATYLGRSGSSGRAYSARRKAVIGNNSQTLSTTSAPRVGAGGALSGAEVARLAAAAGFKGQDLINVVAIAKRESSWKPGAYNPNRETQDDSYGLMQINMLGDLLAPRLKQFGISDPSELYDPATNMRAAYSLYEQSGNSLHPWGGYKGRSNTYNTDVAEATQIVQTAGLGDPTDRHSSAARMPRKSSAPASSVSPLMLGGGSRSYNIQFSPTIKFEGVAQTPELRKMAASVGTMLKEQVELACERNA